MARRGNPKSNGYKGKEHVHRVAGEALVGRESCRYPGGRDADLFGLAYIDLPFGERLDETKAFSINSWPSGNGLEDMRVFMRRYEPRTRGTKQPF